MRLQKEHQMLAKQEFNKILREHFVAAINAVSLAQYAIFFHGTQHDYR